jgi:hypothetical protein
MLSDDQVLALESSTSRSRDMDAFYSPSYARRAAERYAEFLGVTPPAPRRQLQEIPNLASRRLHLFRIQTSRRRVWPAVIILTLPLCFGYLLFAGGSHYFKTLVTGSIAKRTATPDSLQQSPQQRTSSNESDSLLTCAQPDCGEVSAGATGDRAAHGHSRDQANGR